MTVYTKADLKPYLDLKATDNDALLELTIAQAEAWIEHRCGPLVSTTLTKRVRPAASGWLVLPVLPVVSVTSVTGVQSAEVVALEDDEIDLRAGIIKPDFTLTEPFYDVVYVAGWAASKGAVPADLMRLVVEVTRDLWRSQRGSGTRQGDADPGASRRLIAELMAPYQMPGFA